MPLAIDANVKNLFLFNYDCNYDDEQVDGSHVSAEQLIAEPQATMICHRACEGMLIDVD